MRYRGTEFRSGIENVFGFTLHTEKKKKKLKESRNNPLRQSSGFLRNYVLRKFLAPIK